MKTSVGAADSNPVAPTNVFNVKMPVKLQQPDARPDSPSSNPRELAGLFAQAAGALMKIAAHFAGEPFALPDVARAASTPARTAHFGVSVAEACNEFIVSRAKKGCSDKYLRQVRSVLQSFATGRAGLALADVERVHVEKWLSGQHWSNRTQKNNLSTLRILLAWCVRRDWLSRDHLTAGIELGDVTAKPIIIHTPEQAANVLETARVIDLGVMRLLSIRYFAGVRSAEALRLREENILLAHGVIEIPAAKSKTKRRRIVKITPNLRAWLALGGVLIPTGDATIRRVIAQSGVQWSHNVTRHTWESYAVAKTKNRAAVAHQAGHSTEVQLANYDAHALPADARKFFEIRPEPKPREIALKQWGGFRRRGQVA